MTILTQRSAGQIQRTFLPGQTADIGGRVYRVESWPGARPLPIDVDAVRRRLLREIRPFEAASKDSGLASDLRRGVSLEVVEVDTESGVVVEIYPQIWLCRACKRIGKRRDQACRCGVRQWGQFHFLGVHSCGNVVEPFIRRCPKHDDVAVVSPRSAKASDIIFRCPECHQDLAKGLGFVRCSACGQGNMAWNVHKARPVYAPREMVMINPTRPERAAALKAVGGERRALEWVLEGMSARRPQEHRAAPGRTEFIANLVGQGLSRELAETLANQAGAELRESADDLGSLMLPERLIESEHDAFDIAMALSESRLSATELESSAFGVEQARNYRDRYPAALRDAGIFGIDLVDRFPVLSATYGYTRGVGEANELTLRPFRGRNTTYRFHGRLSETEAFFVRLDPHQVIRWLIKRGHDLELEADTDARSIRIALLQRATIPEPGISRNAVDQLGWDLATLVHSFAHRFIRQASVFAGIDRDALSEYLIPNHLGFFVFAAARGSFVLGGLQALFEHDLHVMLDSVVNAESRCPLDPGCAAGGGACPACLHLGEPSCRRFNLDLDRRALFGTDGYFFQDDAGTFT